MKSPLWRAPECTPRCMTLHSTKSWLTTAVKSTQCYLCCLPLVLLSLSFTRLAVSPPPTTSTKHCHWTIADSAQMTSEIALFPPSPRTHVTDVVVAESGLHARIERDVPLAIELTARHSLFLPLFIFLSEKAAEQCRRRSECFVAAGCIRSRYEDSMICFSDESFSASVAGFDVQSPLRSVPIWRVASICIFCVILAEMWEMQSRRAADRRPHGSQYPI